MKFDAPLGRTREYVDIIRMALRRETVAYQGKHWTLPLPDGPGKALRMTIHPVREHLPIYLAAVGPKNLELACDIADGWLAVFFSPEYSADLLASLRAGRTKAGLGSEQDRLDGFDIVPTVPVILNDDVEVAAAPLRAYSALYLGGMGSREKNFYNAMAVRMGFADGAAKVQDLFLARQYREAAAAVPLDFIDQTSLIGPRDRIRDRLSRYAASGVTTLTIAAEGASLDERLHVVRTMAELLDESGLGD